MPTELRTYKLLQFWVRWRLKRIVFQQPGLLLLQPFQCMAEQPKVCQLVVELLDRLRLKRTAAPGESLGFGKPWRRVVALWISFSLRLQNPAGRAAESQSKQAQAGPLLCSFSSPSSVLSSLRRGRRLQRSSGCSLLPSAAYTTCSTCVFFTSSSPRATATRSNVAARRCERLRPSSLSFGEPALCLLPEVHATEQERPSKAETGHKHASLGPLWGLSSLLGRCGIVLLQRWWHQSSELLRRHRTASHWTRSGFRQFVTIVARALLALLALLLALAGFPVLCMLLDLIVIVCSSGYFYLCLCLCRQSARSARVELQYTVLQHRLRDLEILFIRDLSRCTRCLFDVLPAVLTNRRLETH